ncbi:hypothetical protein LY78DRAFT_655857, partial [Colletotrichum sublineola]
MDEIIKRLQAHWSGPKRSKCRRWTDLEEKRLRVYMKEKKTLSWIAESLDRSADAVTQHWIIMEGRPKKTAK